MKKKIINLIFALSLLFLYPSVLIIQLHFISDELIDKISYIPGILEHSIDELSSKKIYCTDYRHRYEDRNNNQFLGDDVLILREYGGILSRILVLSNIYSFSDGTPDSPIYLINKSNLSVTKNFRILKGILGDYKKSIKAVLGAKDIDQLLCPNGFQTDELVDQARKEEIFKDVFAVMREYQPQIQKHVDLQLAQQYKIKYLAYFLMVFETIGMIILVHKFYIHVLSKLIKGQPIRWKDDL